MISLKIQSAIDTDISIANLYEYINNLDLLDIHFQVQKYILKTNNELIKDPPPFSKLLCILFIKSEIVNLSKLINFYSNSEKIILTFFSFKEYDSIPSYFYKINPNVINKYISQFPKTFLLEIQKNVNIYTYSQLIENYKNPIIQFLADNTDPFYFCQLMQFINNESIIDEIKKTNYSTLIINEVKKKLKTATHYNPIYLIFSSVLLQDYLDFYTPVFLQQKTQTKYTVCKHLPINALNNIIQHLLLINLKNYDFSWLNFSDNQKESLIIYLKNKSKQLNNILLTYNIKTIARKYETIKKTINICSAISNNIYSKDKFKISEKALQNLYKAGAISFIERRQYIIQ